METGMDRVVVRYSSQADGEWTFLSPSPDRIEIWLEDTEWKRDGEEKRDGKIGRRGGNDEGMEREGNSVEANQAKADE